jgi:hypothetical protein
MAVGEQVTAQAVLIPRVDARRIFGKEIADNYAVIEINVGNKSPDAALLIHGIFIDYSHWALSGTSNPSLSMADGTLQARSEPFEAATVPSHVASEEYRVVRGQLLDAQMWSKRNWTMRLLTFAGNLVGAYAFSISEEGILKGLNAFTGVFVPGIREVWPDATIDQLNRISDFGYQANKVIPRQGAEVIVGFFPIDRFLTPGFKKLFLKSPALFFAPLQMLADNKLKKEANDVLKGINRDLSVDTLRGSLPCYLHVVKKMRFRSVTDKNKDRETFVDQMNRNADQTCFAEFGLNEQNDGKVVLVNTEKFKNFMALDFISQMSLNSVTVKIDGVMTVDSTTVAAKLDDVTFDEVANCGDDESLCFWADTDAGDGVRTGTIPGSYLTGGNVVIAGAEDFITDVKTISEGSTDQKLKFSFKLIKPIPPDTMLHFVVTKTQVETPGTNVKTLNSLPWDYRVGFQPVAPTISGVEQNGDQFTVSGSNFYDVSLTYPLTVELHSTTGDEMAEVTPTSISGDGKQIEFMITKENQPAACWRVVVRAGGQTVSSSPPTCPN